MWNMDCFASLFFENSLSLESKNVWNMDAFLFTFFKISLSLESGKVWHMHVFLLHFFKISLTLLRKSRWNDISRFSEARLTYFVELKADKSIHFKLLARKRWLNLWWPSSLLRKEVHCAAHMVDYWRSKRLSQSEKWSSRTRTYPLPIEP